MFGNGQRRTQTFNKIFGGTRQKKVFHVEEPGAAKEKKPTTPDGRSNSHLSRSLKEEAQAKNPLTGSFVGKRKKKKRKTKQLAKGGGLVSLICRKITTHFTT